MVEEKALVSVIMPTYNAESYLAESINSVIAQTYNNWELLITDDCSTDDTVAIAKKYADSDSRVKLFIQPQNQGAGAARNNSIMNAKGKYIAFLDADDLWLPEKLEKQVAFATKNNYAFTYTSYQKFSNGKVSTVVHPPKSTTYSKLMYSNVIGCLTAMYDAEKLGKKYMPLIRKRQDMGLWLDILKETPAAYCLKEPLAYYRVGVGMSANKIKILSYQWRFYRDVAKLNFFRAMFTFSVYALKGFSKHRQ
ncbi:glycosyltransferase [Pseudoalteromonas sp. ACER1]|uniref:glycosyltransferase family 2 protein n=1 Tax=unclassified Pseudoalteromonas TaxID=194690 RepID=UPI001F4354A9|nr:MULTISPECIES: glycosyltransferase family 2 protein [unclassified Pseudoalteromonas]MCF2848665.1 glycosyltransferase [Pseudoalteromonas sp. PAST1]MCF2917992.1 glycosyltransferase [Pseudoalteromonas sp. Cn5-37]MCO7209674.1 glycosyltransferase [Pseudoalteromonas sp. ACER1]